MKHIKLFEYYHEEPIFLIYTLPEWALDPIFNNDYSALNQDEYHTLMDFIENIKMEHGKCDFYLPDPRFDDFDLGYKDRNDIDNRGAECYKILLKIFK